MDSWIIPPFHLWQNFSIAAVCVHGLTHSCIVYLWWEAKTTHICMHLFYDIFPPYLQSSIWHTNLTFCIRYIIWDYRLLYSLHLAIIIILINNMIIYNKKCPPHLPSSFLCSLHLLCTPFVMLIIFKVYYY